MTIRKLATSLVLVAALATPALASAESEPNDSKNAAKYCRELRAQMGVDAFRAEHGTNHNKRNAFGKCVSKQKKGKHGLVRRVLRECKAEYAADPAAFLVKYGEPAATESVEGGERPAKPENGEADRPDPAVRAAIHACVKAKVAERLAAVKNAAQTCREERSADPVEFREKYGSNRNKRNAFGKCVSAHAKKAPEAPAGAEQA